VLSTRLKSDRVPLAVLWGGVCGVGAGAFGQGVGLGGASFLLGAVGILGGIPWMIGLMISLSERATVLLSLTETGLSQGAAMSAMRLVPDTATLVYQDGHVCLTDGLSQRRLALENSTNSLEVIACLQDGRTDFDAALAAFAVSPPDAAPSGLAPTATLERWSCRLDSTGAHPWKLPGRHRLHPVVWIGPLFVGVAIAAAALAGLLPLITLAGIPSFVAGTGVGLVLLNVALSTKLPSRPAPQTTLTLTPTRLEVTPDGGPARRIPRSELALSVRWFTGSSFSTQLVVHNKHTGESFAVVQASNAKIGWVRAFLVEATGDTGSVESVPASMHRILHRTTE
jgi:hypothetical protein